MKKIFLIVSASITLNFANDFLIDSQIKRIDKQLQQNIDNQKRLQQEKERLQNQQRMMQQSQKVKNRRNALVYKAPNFGPPKNDWYGIPKVGW